MKLTVKPDQGNCDVTVVTVVPGEPGVTGGVRTLPGQWPGHSPVPGAGTSSAGAERGGGGYLLRTTAAQFLLDSRHEQSVPITLEIFSPVLKYFPQQYSVRNKIEIIQKPGNNSILSIRM